MKYWIRHWQVNWINDLKIMIMLTHQTFKYEQEFDLELGGTLPDLELYYTTYGKLNASRSNVIWVCHAFTGNSNVQDWWPGLFGPGLLFDPGEFFIICVNMPGSCYGSTGPLSVNPVSGIPFYHNFPELTNRDILRSFGFLREHLDIRKIHTVIGCSLGGQQALEWAVSEPELFENLVAIGANAFHSPWGIAFNETQRMAIRQDLTWELSTDTAGQSGMKIARAMALISYRNYKTYKATQSEEDVDKTDNYKAYSYQAYQGEKLARRFNAFSYWVLSKTMDTHNIGRGRGSVENALARVTARSLFIGMDSDILFPVPEQKYLASKVEKGEFAMIDSLYGHDGFLLEAEKLTKVIRTFYGKNLSKKEMVA
jgi:homoserine O-acetyltransferase